MQQPNGGMAYQQQYGYAPQQQQMMNPMLQQHQNWARAQLHQLMSFYPNTILEKQTAELDSYRVPIMLAVSKTPLFIRIDCSKSFPQQKPNMVVLARVVHPDINPKTKVVSTQLLQTWDIFQHNSTLLGVVRDIHARFDSSPPIPEKLANSMNQQAPQQPLANADLKVMPQPSASLAGGAQPMDIDQANAQQQANDNNQVQQHEVKKEKKSAKVQKDLQRAEEKLQKLDEQVQQKLEQLELTELQYMQENEDYLKDFSLSSDNTYINLEKVHEKAQDLTHQLANDNVEKRKQIDEYLIVNQELQYEFEQKQEELKDLLDQYKQKQQSAKCDISDMIKIMADKTKEHVKETKQLEKSFKNGQLSQDEYCTQFKKAMMAQQKANYTSLALKTKQQQIMNK